MRRKDRGSNAAVGGSDEGGEEIDLSEGEGGGTSAYAEGSGGGCCLCGL